MLSAFTDNSGRGMYDALFEFTRAHKAMTYRQFDEHILTDVRLFDVPDDEYLGSVEDMLDNIIRALPSFKRVFARPIIRLKDERQIVPIEAVKVIDKRSLTHVASRCELWEDITDEGIKPRKLMTVENVETYSIYENIAFACAVDTILSYIRQTSMRIKDVFYGCKDIHFNLLDRTHHSLYFLAIGKLYLEYVKSGMSLERWGRCMEKMIFIEKNLRGKLNSPVYRKCHRKNYSIKLKKTNIFRSHKDYKEVYRILNLFKSGVNEEEESGRRVASGNERFINFGKLLSVFAIGHFNYVFSEHIPIDFDRFDFECSFAEWKLRVRTERLGEVDALIYSTKKDREYKTCLIFGEKEDISASGLEYLKSKCKADEYIYCSPNTYGCEETVYLSILDVDSFRRIQQILLRGMLYSDSERARCAFCGESVEKSDNGYVCRSCKAVVGEIVCPESGEGYTVSGILKYSTASAQEKKNLEKRRFLHDRYDEAQLHYRNITYIDNDGNPICPHCGKVHVWG